jgi:hypothetical protein
VIICDSRTALRFIQSPSIPSSATAAASPSKKSWLDTLQSCVWYETDPAPSRLRPRDDLLEIMTTDARGAHIQMIHHCREPLRISLPQHPLRQTTSGSMLRMNTCRSNGYGLNSFGGPLLQWYVSCELETWKPETLTDIIDLGIPLHKQIVVYVNNYIEAIDVERLVKAVLPVLPCAILSSTNLKLDDCKTVIHSLHP